MEKKFGSYLAIGLLGVALALTGCSSGSDGATGPAGPAGPAGPQGPAGAPAATAPSAPIGGGLFSVDSVHSYESRAASWSVTGVEAAADGGAVITANIKVAGENRNDFDTVVSVASNIESTVPGALNSYGSGSGSIVNDGSGNYTITVNRPEGWPTTGDITWMVRVRTAGSDFPEANIVAHQTADGKHIRSIVSNQACINCHGDQVFVDASGGYMSASFTATGERRAMTTSRNYHFSAYGVESCTTCHMRDGRSNLPAYVHGIHNSDNVNQSYGAGSGNKEIKDGWNFGVRYPGNMTTCDACHDTPESLAYVVDQPVSNSLCMSCHDSWSNFPWSSASIESLHVSLGSEPNCALCHDGSTARGKVGDFHVGYDAELKRAENISLEITGASASGVGSQVTVTWRAYNPSTGANYNACNDNIANGPLFINAGAGNTFAIRLSSMQGDDITNHLNSSTSAAGQPATSMNVASANTVCDANGVATTTLTDVAPASARAYISFDGRPRVGAVADLARVPVPVYAMRVADGAHSPRRQIVDSQKCVGCHKGTLYRHGGGRNDNADVCIVCHNPSATDLNRRVGFGVDASEAYDGKSEESFSLAYNMHAIHAAGANNSFFVIYRNQGMYGYGGHETPAPPNWPVDSAGKPRAYYTTIIHGSNPTATIPEGTPIAHYLKRVNYPNVLANCEACHYEGTYDLPDQSKAVALTVAAGASYADQNDDTLISPATAACASCHRSGEAYVTRAVQAHAYQNSWAPAVLPAGKDTALNYGEVETCLVCHGN